VCPSEMSTAWPGSGSWTWACPRTSMRAVPFTLSTRGGVQLFAGRLALASSFVEQVQAVADVDDNRTVRYAVLAVAAVRGREKDARQLITSATRDFAASGEGMGLGLARRPLRFA